MMTQIQHITGYQFTRLADLETLRSDLQLQCSQLALKGTILLSEEGINVQLSGTAVNLRIFKTQIKHDDRFAALSFRESSADRQPFKRLKVKVRKEIITFRQPEIDVTLKRAESLSPDRLKRWLDESRDMALLDVRNDYEVRFGTFKHAIHLNLQDFNQFTQKLSNLPLCKERPLVMFCTGGIRCEKAALYLMEKGYSNVYQLDGGILHYFAATGGAHYEGECFVFDERVSVNPTLQPTSTRQCPHCQGPVRKRECPTCSP